MAPNRNYLGGPQSRAITDISPHLSQITLTVDPVGTISGREGYENIPGKPEYLDIIPGKEKNILWEAWIRTRGVIFAVLSAIHMAVGNYLFFVLSNDYKEYMFSPAEVLAYRFLIVLLLICVVLIPVYKYKFGDRILQNVWPLTESSHRWTVIKLLMRSLTGSAAIILNYCALEYISPGDVSTILWSNLLFVGFLAWVILRERMYFFQLGAALVALIGVMIITRPPFIFGGSGFDNNLLVGVGISLVSMFFYTLATISLRTLGHVHHILINLVFVVTALLSSGIMYFVTKNDIVHVPGRPLETYFYMLIIGIIATTGLICLTLCLKYEAAGPTSVARSSEVFFSILAQIFSGIYPDYVNIIGAALVMFSVVLVGFHTYLLQQPESNRWRRRFWFLLK